MPNISMIFKTQNDELVIFGNTIDKIRSKWNTFSENYDRKHKVFGSDGAFASLFTGKAKTPLTPELLSQFDEFKEKFNNTQLSAEAVAEEMGNVDSAKDVITLHIV